MKMVLNGINVDAAIAVVTYAVIFEFRGRNVQNAKTEILHTKRTLIESVIQ